MSVASVVMWMTKMTTATRAESVMPKSVNTMKTASRPIVVSMIGRLGIIAPAYLVASLAEITAVAMYERMVRHAAMEAWYLLVVLSSALYAPPLSGSAPTTSA